MQTPWRFLVAAILISGPATGAAAETAAARAACTPSVLMLCPAAAAAGDREAAKSCLLKNLAHASRRCRAAVRAEPQQVPNPRSQLGDIQR